MSGLRLILLVGVLGAACMSDAPRVAGASIAFVPLGPERGWIDSVALSPAFASDGRLWAAPFGGGVFASADAAHSWAPSRQGETDPVVVGLIASPSFATDGTVFAAADDGIFRSSDRGQTWTNISFPIRSHFARRVVLSPGYPADPTIFAATDGGVYRTVDGGSSWLASNNLAVPMVSLAATGGALFAGPSSGGLLRSADGGADWAGVATFPGQRTALDVALSPTFASDGTILVGTDSGLYLSTNGGASWSVQLPGDRVPAVAFSPAFARDRVAFAGDAAGHGVYGTTDGGASWGQLGGDPFVETLAVSPSFVTDHTLFAGTAGRGVEMSTDGGRTWAYRNSGLHAAEVAQLRVVGPTVAVAGTGGASVAPLAGGPWFDLPVGTRFSNAIGGSGSDLYLGTQDLSLLVSHDSGATWHAANFPAAAVTTVELSPSYTIDRTILTASGYVYLSADAGQTWQQASGIVGNDLRRFGFSPSFDLDHTVFATTTVHAVLRSIDGGLSWALASSGLPPVQITDVLLSAMYDADHTAYVGTTGDGIYVTRDGGASWAPLSPACPQGLVDALHFAPDGSLLAGTGKGVYELSASGWETLDAGFTDQVTALAFAGTSLFAGTLGDGVWRAELPGPPATVTPTATATFRATSSATPTSTAPSTPRPTSTKTSVTRTLHPHVFVLPSPLQHAQLGLVELHGPAHGHVSLSLTDGAWQRAFSSALPADGRTAFGFTAPSGTLNLEATFSLGSLRATVRQRLTIS